MMKNLRKAALSLLIPALVVTMWWSAGKSQHQESKPASKSSTTASASRVGAPGKVREMPLEEKLVLDVYARLMRYQSAAIDEAGAKNADQAKPSEYLSYDVRVIRSGLTSELTGRRLSDLVTSDSNQVIRIKRVALGDKEGTHAFYEAAWESAAAKKNADAIVNELPGTADFDRYTRYRVKVRFQGQNYSYLALLLYQSGQQASGRPARVRILDYVTSDINDVYSDESPRVRSPWQRYVKTSLYQAVVRTVRETRDAGAPLLPASAPIGYLPGDDASPNDQDARTMAMNTVCPDLVILRDNNPITGTTQNAIVGERINLSVLAGTDEPEDVQWTIGGNRIANFEVNGTGPTGPSSATVTALTNLTDPSVSYYWTSVGQQIEVSVTATVFGTQKTKSARFNVGGPNTTGPTVALETNGHLNISNLGDCSGSAPAPAMVFGSITGPNPGTCTYSGDAGIRFTPPGANGPSGNYFFVQLITAENVTYSHNLGTTTCTGSVAGGLDRDYPYQRRTGQSVSDAPFTPLPSTYLVVSRTFGATTYMMWQSKTRNSIPVPIGSVAWGFSGSTTQRRANSNIWTAPTGSGSAQAFVPASGPNSYPVWTALHSSTCH
jgi:hypothetical protein